MVSEVEVSRKAEKQLRKLPRHVVASFFSWVRSVQDVGLLTTRKLTGFNDEALRGKLHGLRSVRLNKAYRAYYRVLNRGDDVEQLIKVVFVERVDKHEY